MKKMFDIGVSLIVLLLPWVAGDIAQAQDYKAILAHPERPANERELDVARKPEQVLKFYGIKPGDKVADLMAGRGYYTALLSQLVGDRGVVYSAVRKAPDEIRDRFKNPLYANVKLIEGDMDSVALPSDGSLDFVFIHLNYHDLSPETRAAMNKVVFAALKPAGVYGIVDHSAKDGSGNEVTKSLHRIDRAMVVREVTQAGFRLSKEGEMFRNPDDPRTESVMKDRGKSDRFVLRFEKPR